VSLTREPFEAVALTLLKSLSEDEASPLAQVQVLQTAAMCAIAASLLPPEETPEERDRASCAHVDDVGESTAGPTGVCRRCGWNVVTEGWS
jgi:hypothetical protein